MGIESKIMGGKVYRVLHGIFYGEKTSDKMIQILYSLQLRKERVRFHWGNVVTGLDWGDDFDVKGTVSNSTGPARIPILIHNSRSTGGGAILTDCIVKITATKSGRVIYQHPKYHTK